MFSTKSLSILRVRSSATAAFALYYAIDYVAIPFGLI
jgi:hypothetical protein